MNLKELKVVLVRLELDKLPPMPAQANQPPETNTSKPTVQNQENLCFECKVLLPNLGIDYNKSRANHFMQYTYETHSCPVCIFTVPTICALRAHLRFHLKVPPFYCPECGINIAIGKYKYSRSHDCDGFRAMAINTIYKCPDEQCELLDVNEIWNHLKEKHMVILYKCPICCELSYNESIIKDHLNAHIMAAAIPHSVMKDIFCGLCPRNRIFDYNIDNHLYVHLNTVFICWTCGMVFQKAFLLLDHHEKNHELHGIIKKFLMSIIYETENQLKTESMCKVFKRCNQCQVLIVLKCPHKVIPRLPNNCAYKCTPDLE